MVNLFEIIRNRKYLSKDFVFADFEWKLLKNNYVTYYLKYKDRLIWGNNKTAAYNTFKEVLINKCYDFKIKKPETIIDLGGNIGIASVFFRDKFHLSKIICVEPSKENLFFLKKNLKDLNVEVVDNPIWFKVQKLGLTKDVCTPSNKFNDEVNGDYLSTTIPDLMKRFNFDRINLLKIDIEGAEHKLLTKNNDWLDLVDNVFMEIHFNENSAEFNNIFSCLKKHGLIKIDKVEGIYFFTRMRVLK